MLRTEAQRYGWKLLNDHTEVNNFLTQGHLKNDMSSGDCRSFLNQSLASLSKTFFCLENQFKTKKVVLILNQNQK